MQALADRDRRVGGAALGQALEVVERLGAVARLEQERAAGRDLGERGAHLPRLAGEDERRQRVQSCAAPRRRARRRATPAAGAPPGHAMTTGTRSNRRPPRCKCTGAADKLDTADADLLRHPADRRQALRQLLGRLPPVRRHAGAGRGLLLRRRPALDHGRLRAPPTCASARSTWRRSCSRPASTRSARRCSSRAT